MSRWQTVNARVPAPRSPSSVNAAGTDGAVDVAEVELPHAVNTSAAPVVTIVADMAVLVLVVVWSFVTGVMSIGVVVSTP